MLLHHAPRPTVSERTIHSCAISVQVRELGFGRKPLHSRALKRGNHSSVSQLASPVDEARRPPTSENQLSALTDRELCAASGYDRDRTHTHMNHCDGGARRVYGRRLSASPSLCSLTFLPSLAECVCVCVTPAPHPCCVDCHCNVMRSRARGCAFATPTKRSNCRGNE